MTATLSLSLVAAGLLAIAIIGIRDRVRMHTDMNANVTKLMRSLRQGEA